jgi:hypothetical protein
MTKETIFDGTISYTPEASRESRYVLVVRFSEGVERTILPKKLERLQATASGELNARCGSDGILELVMPIVAHGPESACKQAKDLARRIQRQLDLSVNIAAGLGTRPCDCNH